MNVLGPRTGALINDGIEGMLRVRVPEILSELRRVCEGAGGGEREL